MNNGERSEGMPNPEAALQQMKSELEEKLKRSGCEFTFNADHPSGQTFSIKNMDRKFFFDELDHWFFPRLRELGITGDFGIYPDRGPIIDGGRFSFKQRKTES